MRGLRPWMRPARGCWTATTPTQAVPILSAVHGGVPCCAAASAAAAVRSYFLQPACHVFLHLGKIHSVFCTHKCQLGEMCRLVLIGVLYE